MPSREKREQEKVIKSDDFTQENNGDFAANAFATAQFAALHAKRDEIAAEQETKISADGGARQNYEIAAEAEDKLDQITEEVADFAASMTDEFPALEEKFRKPRGSSRRNKIAVARTFAADAAEFKASFIERGLDADFIEKLTTRAANLELALSKAISETAKRVGAVSRRPQLIREALKIIKSVDPIIRKRYQSDPAKLAAWKFATHVERDPKPKPKPPTA